MRRLPGPASRPLCDGVKTPEAHVELFRGWQRTQTQSSVRTLRSLRQQMDVWFCMMQESSAERHCCVTADPDQINCAPSGARPEILCFSLDFDLHRCGLPQVPSINRAVMQSQELLRFGATSVLKFDQTSPYSRAADHTLTVRVHEGGGSRAALLTLTCVSIAGRTDEPSLRTAMDLSLHYRFLFMYF
jgi:hypothetical protein